MFGDSDYDPHTTAYSDNTHRVYPCTHGHTSSLKLPHSPIYPHRSARWTHSHFQMRTISVHDFDFELASNVAPLVWVRVPIRVEWNCVAILGIFGLSKVCQGSSLNKFVTSVSWKLSGGYTDIHYGVGPQLVAGPVLDVSYHVLFVDLTC